MVLIETFADAQQRIADLEVELVAARENRQTTNNGANVATVAANGGNCTANVVNVTAIYHQPKISRFLPRQPIVVVYTIGNYAAKCRHNKAGDQSRLYRIKTRPRGPTVN